jgi:hypothetical protein
MPWHDILLFEQPWALEKVFICGRHFHGQIGEWTDFHVDTLLLCIFMFNSILLMTQDPSKFPVTPHKTQRSTSMIINTIIMYWNGGTGD